MTREQVKKALPLIQAFVEGKTIQTKNGSKWIDIDSDKNKLFLTRLLHTKTVSASSPSLPTAPSATSKNAGKKCSSTPPSAS